MRESAGDTRRIGFLLAIVGSFQMFDTVGETRTS